MPAGPVIAPPRPRIGRAAASLCWGLGPQVAAEEDAELAADLVGGAAVAVHAPGDHCSVVCGVDGPWQAGHIVADELPGGVGGDQDLADRSLHRCGVVAADPLERRVG